jgi:hypothetical protein
MILPLSMVLNELCTNALKCGALSTPSGRVSLATSVDEAGKLLHLTQTESDGPIVKPPPAISVTVPYGDARIDFSGRFSIAARSEPADRCA